MKLFVSAFALAFAVPAAAQTAAAQPAPPEHAGHQMPQGKQHDGHAMKDGCCADKDGNGKMDCCEKMAAKKDDQPSTD
jgi:hypothetical protein